MKKALLLVLGACFLLTSYSSLAQGVTSAALNGIVTDENGEGLPGATVLAKHIDTGSDYGTVTNLDGKYIFANVKPGIYQVTFSFIGYETQIVNQLNLPLGKNIKLDAQLNFESTQLEAVEVVAARSGAINPSKTGAATNISQEQVSALPTLSRNLADFARLSPQFSAKNGGLSFAGQNNRFNNISIDGAVNNDVFGLSDGGTPGDRQGAQPISLDAIEELQVVIAPFDVRQSGFTGGGVNAVTKSGTNDVKGSVYFFGRNNDMVGNKVGDQEITINKFYDIQSGFRVGGPIIKNKMFYFVNYERGMRQEPALQNFANGSFSGNPSYANELDILDSIRYYMTNRFGYDPGNPRDETVLSSVNDKIIAKFDWSINKKHKLTYRINYTDAFKTEIFRNFNNFSYNTSGYDLDFKVLGNVVELQSMFSSSMSNEFRVSYNRIRDRSIPGGRDFPSMRINPLPSGSTVVTGLDRFRGANSLNQDLFEITNNFTWFKGNHVLTFGTRNEIYAFDNLFIPSFGGEWTFPYDAVNGLKSLAEGLPTQFTKTYSRTDNLRESAKWSAILFGLYAQDEWNVTPDMRLTLGIRGDLPVMLGKVGRNAQFEQSFLMRNDVIPVTRVLWSPRVGFNWNVGGNDATQIRGGFGLFTGRPPFVWLSNQYSRDGVSFASSNLGVQEINALFAGQDEQFIREQLANPYYVPDVNLVNQTVEINITNPNFRLPQVARFNAAIDQKLPGDFVLTFDGLFSKSVNEIYVTNINLKGPIRTIPQENGRMIFGENQRPDFFDSENFTNVYVLENTNQGYQYSLTFQLQRNVRNFFSTFAYTHGRAKDIVSLSNSTASGNFQNNRTALDINAPDLGFSDFDQRHRVIGALGYTFNYARSTSTQFSVFYNAQNGNRFSFLVGGGDMNGDGIFNNELMYIPIDRNDILFVGDNVVDPDPIKEKAKVDANYEKWKQLYQIIEDEPSLRNNRGKFAERNGAVAPWEHQFDIRILQNLFVNVNGKKHNVQLSLDILNVGNLLNPEWGLKYFGRSNVLLFRSYDAASGRPIYDLANNYEKIGTSAGLRSVYQMQVGLRYSF